MERRFKRVSESQAMPDSISRAFLGSEAPSNRDRFAGLRAGQTARRQAIAREIRGEDDDFYEEETPEWEQLRQAQRYSDPRTRLRRDEVDIEDEAPELFSNRSVRRLVTASDTYEGGYRGDTRTAFDNPHLSAFARAAMGASLFEYDMTDIEAELMEENESRKWSQHERKAVLEKDRARWQERAARDARAQNGRGLALARANSVVRIANERSGGRAMNILDEDYIERRERERERTAANRQAELARIKSSHYFDEEEDWQQGARERNRAQRTSSYAQDGIVAQLLAQFGRDDDY